MRPTETLGHALLDASGQEFGRDRSTIHHACGLIETMREESSQFDSTLRWMETLRNVSLVQPAQ